MDSANNIVIVLTCVNRNYFYSLSNKTIYIVHLEAKFTF